MSVPWPTLAFEMHGDLILDPSLRDWVFIPLTFAIVMMNMLRQYAHTYMNTGDDTSSSDVKEIREQQVIRRSKRLRMVAGALTYEAFSRRKAYFVGKESGILQQEVKSANMQEKMMSDPSMMTNMMKKQLTGTAPHLLMGFLVNQFFAGFIMGKVPFTLSPRFRTMLQRGIDMSSLDVSYFTSLSFYVLLLFGLKGILSLIFSGDTIDESAVMRQSMAGTSPAFDAKNEFNAEKQRYDLVDHKWMVANAEESAIEILVKRVGPRPNTSDKKL